MSSCCQTRITLQPSCFSFRVTNRSRALFWANFRLQKALLLAGCVACVGQQCQKQPSTKTASRHFGNTKSGLPNTRAWRRQPVMRWRRKSDTIASSVDRFPLPRTRDMMSERFREVKTSIVRPVRFVLRLAGSQNNCQTFTPVRGIPADASQRPRGAQRIPAAVRFQ